MKKKSKLEELFWILDLPANQHSQSGLDLVDLGRAGCAN